MSIRYLPFVFLLALLGCNQLADRDQAIALQPFTGFPKSYIDSLIPVLETEFSQEVIVLPEIDLPAHAFINVKSPRYRADTLIRFLKTLLPDTCSNILGLTTKDISVTKRNKEGEIKTPEYRYGDFGIFGLAYRPGKSAIVSTFRIGKTTVANKLARFKKISTHEIGHNLGLPHCTYSTTCVMADAVESIRTVDNCQPSFCTTCKLEKKG